MVTQARESGAPRFVAYSTLTREPVMVGADSLRLLADTRDVPALGYGNRFVEVLDCGVDGPDAGTVTMSLDAARELYRTVFRGAGALGQPGMPAFPLVDPLPASPDRAATLAVVDSLSLLVDRARAAGQPRLASILDRALAEARAEVGRSRDDAAP